MKPKLLIIELWGLGDLALAASFIQIASHSYDVTLLAKPYAHDLQRRLWPQINVVAFNAPWTAFTKKYHVWRWPIPSIIPLIQKLSAEKFDVGLSARWDPRDHFLLKIIGAKKRLGFPRMGSEYFLTQPLLRPAPESHRSQNWQVLAQALGFKISETEKKFTASTNRNLILIHTGAGQSVRVWPLENYRSITTRLRTQKKEVQIVCDLDQRDWWLSAGEKNVTTPRTVNELIDLIDQAAAFIGNDSGPGHIAACCDVPTFTIFGPQLPEWFAPVSSHSEWIEGKPCPYKPCSDYCRYPVPHCLWNITVDEVWQRVEKFLERYTNSFAT